MSGALASPRSPGAARSPWGLFAPSCKGCESVFSTETQGIFQIGDRTVSLYAHVKATRTVSPPRPFTSAPSQAPLRPPVCIAPALVNLFFLTLVFCIFFGQNRPDGKGKAPTKLPFFPIFCPAKFPLFSIFLQKRGIAKIAAKAQKTFAKSKSRKPVCKRGKKQKSRPQTQKKAAPPQKARNDQKKRKGAPKKHGEAIVSSPLSAFCNRTPKSRQKQGKTVPLAVRSSVKPRIRRKKRRTSFRGEKKPQKA